VLDPRAQRRQRRRNTAQTVLLLGCLLAVAAGTAWLLFGAVGLLGPLAVGGVVLLARPRVRPGAVLALYRAQPLPRPVAPELNWIVDRLTERAGLPHRPALYYVPSSTPNSFTVGRGADAALATTDGLLRRLTRREIAAVLAHEVGHLRAGDTTVMILTDAIVRLTQGLGLLALACFPVVVLLAFRGDARPLVICAALVVLPLVVTLLQLALSRAREFEADLVAAALTGDPEGLALALEVLEETTGRLWERILLTRSRVPDPLLLRTHPATEERTRRLRALEPRDRWPVVGRAAPPIGYPHVPGPPRLRPPGIRW
jgi:heat shock protein HtpX